jgi:hypothetical protein
VRILLGELNLFWIFLKIVSSIWEFKPQRRKDSLRLYRLDNKIAYIFTYAFFKDSFATSTDKGEIMRSIFKGFKSTHLTLTNYKEDVEDEDSRMIPYEKNLKFFLNICILFVQNKNKAFIFENGINTIITLLASFSKF